MERDSVELKTKLKLLLLFLKKVIFSKMFVWSLVILFGALYFYVKITLTDPLVKEVNVVSSIESTLDAKVEVLLPKPVSELEQEWVLLSKKILFFFILFIIFSGVCFAFFEIFKSVQGYNSNELKYGPDGYEVRTDLIGLLFFSISVGFIMYYLKLIG